MGLYKTRAGDSFDWIALKLLGDEFLAAKIVDVNPEHAGTLIFKAGTMLIIPDVPEAAPETLPPWKRGDHGA